MKKIFVLAAIPAMIFAATSASASGMWVDTITKAHQTEDLARVGNANEATQLDIVVGLKLRNRDELTQYIERMHNPSDLMYRQSLSHEFVEANYGPRAEDAALVVEHLRNSGFTDVEAVGQIVRAKGTIANAKIAFNTDFAEFKMGGETVFANTGKAQVPAQLDGIVESVIGLNNIDRAHVLYHTQPEGVQPDLGGFNPASFAKAYGATSSTTTGSNTVVGIITDGNMTSPIANLKTFESKNGIAATTVKTEGPGGSDTSGNVEWDLDTQDIIGMSGGVKTMILYAAASLSDSALATDYNLVVSDNTAKAINVSLGECEINAKTSGAQATEDAIFQKAVAQGQTFFVATGDSGFKECKTKPGQSSPATSPYVTAVGGTTLKVTTSGTYSSETTWTGGGGGPSVEETEPTWQKPVTAITGGKRGVADWAFDANPSTGAKIYISSTRTETVGGTSLATPLATGAWSRAESASGNTLGFAAPLFYTLAEGSKYSTTFHDITSGNNGGENAAKGWDYPTGWGSANVDAFVTAIK